MHTHDLLKQEHKQSWHSLIVNNSHTIFTSIYFLLEIKWSINFWAGDILAPSFSICDRWRQSENQPEDIVDPDDVLLTGVLGINGDGGAGLDPDVAAVLLDPAVVLGDTLSFIHHWGRKRTQWMSGAANVVLTQWLSQDRRTEAGTSSGVRLMIKCTN